MNGKNRFRLLVDVYVCCDGLDLSGLCFALLFSFIIPTRNSSHYQVVDSLLQWHARFGLPTIHISDQASYFKHSVCEELRRILGITHRFTPANTPHSNGTVELVNRLILRLFRTLMSEYKIADYKQLSPLVQAALNLNGSPSLGDLSPTEVFTGLKVTNAVSLLFDATNDIIHECLLPSKIMDMTTELRDALANLHNRIYQKKEH